ncbi:LytR/AlgR family response regulator transcription factor [Sphingobacterium tabacisoli]|uniref:LytR/AlgR family response regulator transcription factor n=1 Tax=Sphingobacterium tabacisoli TaxID=2044855 RepID=A0ABW5L461_9SPHI|nr:LytTR family DNA-binding domain-containing protein [Sphingobacterium tabacisoli]
MNVLIIEDEQPNAERLKRLILEIRPQAVILDVLESISESVDWLSNNPFPDVIMMDIQLSDGVSFEIFNQVKLEVPIVFVTAYDEYAIKAFKQYSVDYLLKPVDRDELVAAFEKLDYITQISDRQSFEKLLTAFQPKKYRNRFLIPFRDEFKTILVSDIHYFSSEMRITKAYLIDGSEIIIPQTLDELEKQLDPRLFFRANRQFIVHIDSISRVFNYFNSKLKVILKNNSSIEIIVSRDKAPLLKSWLGY